MAKKEFFLFLLCLWLFGCGPFYKKLKYNDYCSKVEINYKVETIEEVIEEARILAKCRLKEIGIKPEGKDMVFKTWARTRHDVDLDSCYFFYGDVNYSYVNKNLYFGVNSVVPMVLDQNNNYIAIAGHPEVCLDPQVFNDYCRERRMIDIAQEKGYITYIQLTDCSEKILMGYSEGGLDFYRYSDNDLEFLYSK